MNTSRRGAMLGAGAALLAPTLAAAGPLGDRVETYRAHARIRCGGSGKVALHWMRGDLWGRVESRPAQCLFQLEQCSYTRLTVQPDGSLEIRSQELGTFKDAVTGAYIDSWTNPFNGARCEVPMFGMGGKLNVMVYQADGSVQKLSPDVAGSLGIGRPERRAGRVWITQDNSVQIKRADPANPSVEVVVNTAGLATFSALAADVDNTAVERPPTICSFNELADWWPWMKMGEIRGLQLWRLNGFDMPGPQALPPAFADRLERVHAGWLERPAV